MAIKRMIEVWEKGADGGFVGRIELFPNLETALLLQLFAGEQDRPDAEMLAAYWLDAAKCKALQSYSPTLLDSEAFDYILSVTQVG